jgi:hypothetical protein
LPSEATWRASSSGVWRIISMYQEYWVKIFTSEQKLNGSAVLGLYGIEEVNLRTPQVARLDVRWWESGSQEDVESRNPCLRQCTEESLTLFLRGRGLPS